MIYYLDTTIQLTKLFGPSILRRRIKERINDHICEEAYPQMADGCRRVLANPADAQGNLCKTLGDVIIALQTPTAAVLWSTDAAYDVICPTLGIAHVREPLVTQTS